MKAQFFGHEGRKLFGAYHAPASHVRGAQAILLCSPGVHEYSAAHWAFRRLAAQLSRAGNHVLRFDYFGSGDSAGLPEEQTFEGLVADAKLAATELRDLSGARQISLVGLRLGATVALEACRNGVRAHSLVLWSPVVSGAAYLKELEDWDAVHNRKLLHFMRTLGSRSELLGFPMNESNREEWRRVNALAGVAPTAERAILFAERETDELLQLRRVLADGKLDVSFEPDSSESGQQRGGKAILSNEVLVRIAQRFARGGTA